MRDSLKECSGPGIFYKCAGDRFAVPFGCDELVQGQAVVDLVKPAVDCSIGGVIRSLYNALTVEHPDEMRWADSESSMRRRPEEQGLGWSLLLGAGKEREPHPRIVPRWITGHSPKQAGKIDHAVVQIVLACPRGHSRRMCSRDSVTSSQTEYRARYS